MSPTLLMNLVFQFSLLVHLDIQLMENGLESLFCTVVDVDVDFKISNNELTAFDYKESSAMKMVP